LQTAAAATTIALTESGSSGDLPPPPPPAEKATAGRLRLSPALWSVAVPSTVMLRDCQTGGENDRLDAGAYHGSRRRLRHSISAVGTEIPCTKKRPLVAGPFHQAATEQKYPVALEYAKASFERIKQRLRHL